MEKNVDDDPMQYSEEWFNMVELTGKEFELPNISSTFYNWWFSKNENLSMPNLNLDGDAKPSLLKNHELDSKINQHRQSISSTEFLQLQTDCCQDTRSLMTRSKRYDYINGFTALTNQLLNTLI